LTDRQTEGKKNLKWRETQAEGTDTLTYLS
jgi:hypothetical protein